MWTTQKPPQGRSWLGAEIQPMLPLPNQASWTRDESGQKGGLLSVVRTKVLSVLTTACIFVRSGWSLLPPDRPGPHVFSIRTGKTERSQSLFLSTLENRQKSIISVAMKEGSASKHFQSPWPYIPDSYFDFLVQTGSKPWFPTSKFFLLE